MIKPQYNTHPCNSNTPSVVSHKSNSDHPSCSSISTSSSYVREYKKCEQCGKRLHKSRPNRQCAMEIDLDGEFASIDTLHMNHFTPSTSIETSPAKCVHGDGQVTNTTERKTDVTVKSSSSSQQLRQFYCEKCYKEKSAELETNKYQLQEKNSKKDISGSNVQDSNSTQPESGGTNGLRTTVNVFTFIRATFSRILESKAISPTTPNAPQASINRSSTIKSKGLSRQSSVNSPPGNEMNTSNGCPKERLPDLQVNTRPPLSNSTKLNAMCGAYVNALGCSSESLEKWKLTKENYIDCSQQQPKSSVSSGIVSNPTGSTAPFSTSTKSHRPSSEHVGFVFPDQQGEVVSSNKNGRRLRYQYQCSGDTSAHDGSQQLSCNSNQNSMDATPNEFQNNSMETDEFLESLPTYYAARIYYGAPTQVDLDMFHHRNPRFRGQYKPQRYLPLGAAYSLPSQTRSITSQGGVQVTKDVLCSTWPPLGRRVFVPTFYEDAFERIDSMTGHQSGSRRHSSNDFNIPFDDIKLVERIKHGKTKDIYRGNWHGDVMIHVFHMDHFETRRFWQEVEKLTTIRHENIDLFMGASFELQRCCIVTNAHSGTSLYDKLHTPGIEKTSLQFTHHVLCQLVKAMGYLHGRSQKPIVVGRLTSKCIFIEPEVVLTLLDYENYTDEDSFETGETFLPNLFLYYAAPELLWSASASEQRMVTEALFTTATDVFAFGTIVYELVTNDYPFSHLSPEKLIQAVSYGQRANFTALKISDFLKGLLRECWSQDPLSRPEFSSICECLLHGQFTHKRHSSSEPENLHRNTSLFSRFNFE